MPPVSVIVPTLDAESVIARLCASLARQSVLSELIVVDSASNDRTRDIARSLGARVITIRREQFDHGATRNLGAAAANGEVLVFLTQDALPFDNLLLEKLIRPLREQECAASYGRHMPKPDANPTETFARLFNYPETPMIKDRDRIADMGIKTFFFSNVCSAVKANVLHSVGGFPHNLIMDEDLFFAANLIMKGYKIAYVPEARVIHSHNYSLFHQFRRYFDMGVVFGDNHRLIDDIPLNQEGAKFVRAQLAYLQQERKYCWIFYFLFEALARYSGHTLGRRYKMIPDTLRRLFSMHRGFWENKAAWYTGQDSALR